MPKSSISEKDRSTYRDRDGHPTQGTTSSNQQHGTGYPAFPPQNRPDALCRHVRQIPQLPHSTGPTPREVIMYTESTERMSVVVL